MSVIVKICGITSLADGVAAAEAGADAVGFVFHKPSPRFVPLNTAAGIIQQLPPWVVKVGVFVNASEEFVLEAIRQCGLGLLQFHGDEPPEYCRQFAVMSMKAFRIRDAASLQALEDYPTDAWLLDTYAADKPGGTGDTFNWELLQARRWTRPFFLAGGLTPDNVSQAVARVRPYGVDVSSGVETAPGKKDPGKVRAFVAAAKAAAERNKDCPDT